MNEITVFVNKEFGLIRTTVIENVPWFIAADVCRALDISNSRDAISRLDDDEKGVVSTDTPGGTQAMQAINEPGLYSLVLGSRKPEAKSFKRWITHEVIPSIRKTGGYIAGQEKMSDDELMAAALQVAQRKIAERDLQIAEMEPKALFADCVTASEDTILIRDLAKMIQQNGVSIGGGRLWEWMRKHGYICKNSCMPTQNAMEMGLFKIEERSVNTGDDIRLSQTTKVTGKGQRYFINKFCGVKS